MLHTFLAKASLDVVVVFLLLTLNMFHTFSGVCVVDFEQVNVTWYGCSSKYYFMKVESQQSGKRVVMEKQYLMKWKIES